MARDAFTVLFNRYSSFINKEAYFKCGRNQTDAEDVVQETFAVLWEKRLEINPHLPLPNYLFKVMFNITSTRKRKIEVVNRHRKFLPNESTDNPFRQLDLKDQIQKGIDQISAAGPKEAIKLYYINDFGYTQMEEITGRKTKKLRNAVWEGLRQLKKVIKTR